MLQQNVTRAVCLMYELIESEAPVAPGRVTLIRTAIEYAFRSAVYCDMVERVRALERTQRQNQSAPATRRRRECRPPPKAAPPLTASSQPVPNKTLPKIRLPGERIFADLLTSA